jgi:hypothetical protein
MLAGTASTPLSYRCWALRPVKMAATSRAISDGRRGSARRTASCNLSCVLSEETSLSPPSIVEGCALTEVTAVPVKSISSSYLAKTVASNRPECVPMA